MDGSRLRKKFNVVQLYPKLQAVDAFALIRLTHVNPVEFTHINIRKIM